MKSRQRWFSKADQINPSPNRSGWNFPATLEGLLKMLISEMGRIDLDFRYAELQAESFGKPNNNAVVMAVFLLHSHFLLRMRRYGTKGKDVTKLQFFDDFCQYSVHCSRPCCPIATVHSVLMGKISWMLNFGFCILEGPISLGLCNISSWRFRYGTIFSEGLNREFHGLLYMLKK